MGIKYVGSAKDYSGYGEAIRHDIASLVTVGIDITVECPRYTLETADYGLLAEKIDPYIDKQIEYDTIIIHTTPDIVGRYYEKGKYHIARVFWETDKIPQGFVHPLSQYIDEVWTGSEFNKQAIINAGYKKPVYIIPQAIDTSIDIQKVKPYITEAENTFKFYSIFEWTERKNPKALLEAYWQEFGKNEPVSLTIKTYIDNHTPQKRQEVYSYVENFKITLGLKEYAKTYLVIRLMNREEIYRFHSSFDCFISTHRGEGWGLPQMEALYMGNTVISTGCGGIHEYISKEEGLHALPYELVPLSGNTRNQVWYTYDQKWAECSINAVRNKMRDVYTNSQKNKEFISNSLKSKFNFDVIGQKMKDRLQLIKKDIVDV